MVTKDKSERSVCFSPEKHKLLQSIAKKQSGCELKRFRRSDTNDILVTDYTSVKQQELPFKKPSHEIKYTPLSTVADELGLLEMVNVTGIIHSLGNIENIEKDGRTSRLRKGCITDESDTFPITFYGNLADVVKEKQPYSITNVRISKYMTERFLKTTQLTTVNSDAKGSLNIEETSLVDTGGKSNYRKNQIS